MLTGVQTVEIDTNELLEKANRILDDCYQYVSEKVNKDHVADKKGIYQVEKIFGYQGEYFVEHHTQYILLKQYEDEMYFKIENKDFYHKHLVYIQKARKLLVDAIRTGIEDGTIRKELEPKQEADLLEGAFGSVLRRKCEEMEQLTEQRKKEILLLLGDCARISMSYLKND